MVSFTPNVMGCRDQLSQCQIILRFRWSTKTLPGRYPIPANLPGGDVALERLKGRAYALHEVDPRYFLELGFGVMHKINIHTLEAEIVKARVQLMLEICRRHAMTPATMSAVLIIPG